MRLISKLLALIGAASCLVALATLPLPVSAEPFYTLDDYVLFRLPSWAACGGRPVPGGSLKLDVPAFLPIAICVGKTDETIAARDLTTIAEDLQGNLDAGSIRLQWTAEVDVALMHIFAEHHEYTRALSIGRYANHLAGDTHTKGGSTIGQTVQTTFWDMLSPDMRDVVHAHGGSRTKNLGAWPSDYKSDGDRMLWTYKSGGTQATAYLFAAGKLTHDQR